MEMFDDILSYHPKLYIIGGAVGGMLQGFFLDRWDDLLFVGLSGLIGALAAGLGKCIWDKISNQEKSNY